MLQMNNGCDLSGYGVSNDVSPTKCGYLNATAVATLAAHGESVILFDGLSDSRGSVESSSAGAVKALIDGVSWHGQNVTWAGSASWDFSFSSTVCRSTRATGWPQMYHACRNRRGVHWLTREGHSSRPRGTSRSRTMLRMKKTCPSASAPTGAGNPTASPGGGGGGGGSTGTSSSGLNVSVCSCYGKAPGRYNIAGIRGVYCAGNHALLQHYFNSEECNNKKGGYGPSTEVTMARCGYLDAVSVSVLAHQGVRVVLTDEGHGSVYSPSAVEALMYGTNWHAGDVEWSGADWRFDYNPRICSGPKFASKWPNMTHACGDQQGVHWLHELRHSSQNRYPTRSRTWLEMREVEDCDAPVLPPTPTTGSSNPNPATQTPSAGGGGGGADDSSCSCGNKTTPGVYTIAGIKNVYCNGRGLALIQHYNSFNAFQSCRNYGFNSAYLTPDTCGYHSAADVAKLARHGARVVLQDNRRGTVSSAMGIQALRDGTSWHEGSKITDWQGFPPWNFDPVVVNSDYDAQTSSCVRAELTSGWPQMNHACGRSDGVQWYHSALVRHSSELVTDPSAFLESWTWIKMEPSAPCVDVDPPASQTANAGRNAESEANRRTSEKDHQADVMNVKQALVIVAGCIVAIIIFAVVLACVCRRQQRQRAGGTGTGERHQQNERISTVVSVHSFAKSNPLAFPAAIE